MIGVLYCSRCFGMSVFVSSQWNAAEYIRGMIVPYGVVRNQLSGTKMLCLLLHYWCRVNHCKVGWCLLLQQEEMSQLLSLDRDFYTMVAKICNSLVIKSCLFCTLVHSPQILSNDFDCLLIILPCIKKLGHAKSEFC